MGNLRQKVQFIQCTGLCLCVFHLLSYHVCWGRVGTHYKVFSLSQSCCGIIVPIEFAFLHCVMSTNTTFYECDQDACHENKRFCGAMPCWWTGTSQCSVTWIQRERAAMLERTAYIACIKVVAFHFIFQRFMLMCRILVQSNNAKQSPGRRGLNEVHVNLTFLMVWLSSWSFQLYTQPCALPVYTAPQPVKSGVKVMEVHARKEVNPHSESISCVTRALEQHYKSYKGLRFQVQ